MAIDAARVSSLIDELGLEGADKEYITKVLTTNERAATAFVGQRHRHDDYTKKTQELSASQKEIERKANDSIKQYATQLQQADAKIKKIMTDFQSEKTSRAQAEGLLMAVKETYNLSDDDIPAVKTPAKVTDDDKGIDIKAVLADFKKELMGQIVPELMAFPQVSAIQQEIKDRHFELTGKRLSLTDMQDLMKTSQAENGPPLMRAWRDKFSIDTIEKTKEREEWSKQDRQKWEDEAKTRRSEEALRGVRSTADGEVKTLSPVIGRKYSTHEEPASRFEPTQKVTQNTQQQNTQNQQSNQKLTGAERAAAKWTERRMAGIGLGKDAPQGANQ